MGGAELQRLLDLEAAAEVLNVSPRSVQRLVRDEKLKAVHVGRSLRFHPDDLLAFIQRNRK